MSAKLKTAVLGATGYAGFELVCLLARHPHLSAPLLFSRDNGHGGPSNLAEVFPAISGNGGFPLERFNWDKLRDCGVDLLFLLAHALRP